MNQLSQRVLVKKGGRFVAEMGGHGNIASIVWALQKSMEELKLSYIEDYFPWYFPTLEEYQSKLEGAGFTVEMIRYMSAQHRF
ncbi:hypothetical protein [Lysinibacillus sp. Ag94]|uniref:hypothetical protein n=1 Tax=Lysinibacillus sp. Ag94 TaxID=2936682 RepID=UPI00200F105F|nr:hypothetical protein [Lysinibacillus sp. Ag94]UPW84913.1 hypothetical protein MY533_08720 [Lysinibacillus sp. Ag94]